jgi:MFS family permease
VLSPLRNRLFPNPAFYGWVIVAVGFLCSILTSPGQSFVISLYLEPVMADLELSRVEISSLYAFATLASAACLPLVGRLADRIPSGRFLGGVLALLALAMVGFSAVQTVAGLAISFFLLRLLGQGAIGLGTLTATVRWFRRYRGRALALVGLGYAFGGLIYPSVIYRLLEGLGWRGSLLALAVVYFFIAAPLVSKLVRERRPGDEPVDGAAIEGRRGSAAEYPPEISFSLREALKLPVFWALLIWLAIIPLVHTAVIFHQVALFSSVGWGAALVPAAFMAYSLAGVVMTYATGMLLERIPTRSGLTLSLALSAVGFGLTALPLSPVPGALLYGTVLGLASGAHAATSSIIWPDYFGVESLGALKGVASSAMSGATALGPPIAALLMATSGSFDSTLIFFAMVCLAGSLTSPLLRKPLGGSIGAPPAAAKSSAARLGGKGSGRAA